MNKQKKEILTPGFTAGTRAIDNYDTCCDKFGFKKTLRGNFAQQKMLYAKNATDEGYSVWMLAHSSLNESFSRKGRWYNIFVGSDVIREIWFNPSDISGSQDDYSHRVCFAKTRDGNYVFKGIYKPQKIDWEKIPDGKTELVRTFVRISSTYPVGIEEKTIDENTQITETKTIKEIPCVTDNCRIEAWILEQNKSAVVVVDLSLRPFQKELIGKKVGDRFKLPKVSLTYEIRKILIKE